MQSQKTRLHSKDQKISHFILLHLLVVACLIHFHAPSDANAEDGSSSPPGQSDTGSSSVAQVVEPRLSFLPVEVPRIEPRDSPGEVPRIETPDSNENRPVFGDSGQIPPVPFIDPKLGEEPAGLSNEGTPPHQDFDAGRFPLDGSGPPPKDSNSPEGEDVQNRLELFDPIPTSFWPDSIANPLSLGPDFDPGLALALAVHELAVNQKDAVREPAEHPWLDVLDIEGRSPNTGIPNGQASDTRSNPPGPALNHSNKR